MLIYLPIDSFTVKFIEIFLELLEVMIFPRFYNELRIYLGIKSSKMLKEKPSNIKNCKHCINSKKEIIGHSIRKVKTLNFVRDVQVYMEKNRQQGSFRAKSVSEFSIFT